MPLLVQHRSVNAVTKQGIMARIRGRTRQKGWNLNRLGIPTTLDPTTRIIAIGLGIFAVGLVISVLSAGVVNGIGGQGNESASYCGGSCSENLVLATLGTVIGGIIALVGVILTAVALVHKFARPASLL